MKGGRSQKATCGRARHRGTLPGGCMPWPGVRRGALRDGLRAGAWAQLHGVLFAGVGLDAKVDASPGGPGSRSA